MKFSEFSKAQNPKDWINRHPVLAIAAAASLALTGLSFGNISENFASLGEMQSQVREYGLITQRLEAGEMFVEQQARIAEARYSRGCKFVTASLNPGKFTTLSENSPVIDAVRGTPLPPGMVVCDASGNTAIIKDLGQGPVATDFAFTGKMQAVNDAIAAQQATGELYQPNVQ